MSRQKAQGTSQKRRRVVRLALPFAFGLLPFAFCASEASAEIVVFKTGRSMSVQSYKVDGALARLVLREGGEVSFPASMVARVDPDEVAYPAVAMAAALPGQSLPAPGVADEVLKARPFADLIATVAANQKVDARLVHAVIEQESNYQARARSPKGAQGLMQLMPATARQYGVRNSYDPQANVTAGVRHLKDLMTRFELPLALAAYNAGEGTIQRYGGVPPFPETQNYVRRILQNAGR
jgi:soluble lytic murein transglycosylase-like protein